MTDNLIIEKSNQSLPSDTQENRPDWLDDKYSSVEDQAKAYTELVKLRAMEQSAKDKVKHEESITKDVAETSSKADQSIFMDQENSEEDLPISGLDFSKYETEFLESDQLSDQSYQELEASGITRDIVDSYITGQKALADKQTEEIYSVCGGQDHFMSMANWAKANLSSSEIEAYDNSVKSGDIGQAVRAVRGIYQQYIQANGMEGSSLQGSAKGGDLKPFNSIAELKLAMKNPQYAQDPAYRSDIEKRLKVSTVL